jgi:hypothetical protein
MLESEIILVVDESPEGDTGPERSQNRSTPRQTPATL